jgi:alpha-beta hydrolase superfamily lysophospholipase
MQQERHTFDRTDRTFDRTSDRTPVCTGRHQTFTFPGQGGLCLFGQSWHPAGGEPRAAVLALHGYGEHSGQMQALVRHLVPRGYAVYAWDLRGHGHSQGRRGYVAAWRHLHHDLDAFFRLVQEREGDRTRFLFGHSMGGLLALDYALHRPGQMRGVIAAGPALAIFMPTYLLLLAVVVSRLWPTLSREIFPHGRAVSRDPRVVRAYEEDPQVIRRGYARLGGEMVLAARRVMRRAGDLQVPLLLLHGGADRAALPEGSRAFFAGVGHPDKTHVEYPGGYHRIWDDINRDEVLGDLTAWLDARA